MMHTLVEVRVLEGFHLIPVPQQAILEVEQCVVVVAVALLLEYILKRLVHRLAGVDPFLDIHCLVNLHELSAVCIRSCMNVAPVSTV